MRQLLCAPGGRTHLGHAILTFFDRLAAGCLRKQPAGGEENRRLFIFSARTGTSAGADSGLRKGLGRSSESTVNALSCFLSRSPRATFATSVSTRESILFRVPPSFSMFPGRLASFAQGRTPSSTDADFTKQQRSACAGSNYVWIMRGRLEITRKVKVRNE